MPIKRYLKKIGIALTVLLLLIVVGTLLLSKYIEAQSKERIFTDSDAIPPSYTAIVLGASVRSDGNLSLVLRDRVESALNLYNEGIVERFLLSGDNGTLSYNEPRAMKKFLIERGVPEAHIYLDYAGFDTYDSLYRAKAIFEVDEAIIVTQKFHLPRAVFIADRLGLEYYGYVADQHAYAHESSNKNREMLANVKAYFEVLFHKEPTYLGEKIPITGPPQPPVSSK